MIWSRNGFLTFDFTARVINTSKFHCLLSKSINNGKNLDVDSSD